MDTSPTLTDGNPAMAPLTSTHLVDASLTDIIRTRAREAAAISPYYEALWLSIDRLVTIGGKRLRPRLLSIAYRAYGGRDNQAILPAATSQELIHLAMLIHDDIIDREFIRYGIDNVSGWYNHQYQTLLPNTEERRHFADSAALLAGDVLISEAFLQLGLSQVAPELVFRSQEQLHRAIFRVAGGELLDTEAAFRPAHAIDPLTIATEKTASYSFIGPLVMGATLAGAPEQELSRLTHIGATIGVAYQLRDDIMGVFGDAVLMGKSADSDLTEGKRTVLINEFFKRASSAQQARFNVHFGNQAATSAQLDELRQLLDETGAKAAIEQYIHTHHTQAIGALHSLSVDSSARVALTSFIDRCLDRSR